MAGNNPEAIMTHLPQDSPVTVRCEGCRRYLPLDAYAPGWQRNSHYPKLCRDCARVRRHNYIAHQWGRAATLTIRDWLAKVQAFGGKCAYCGAAPYSNLDHLVDLRVGGGSVIENCFPTCHPCNLRKQGIDARMGMLAAPEPFRSRTGKPHPFLIGGNGERYSQGDERDGHADHGGPGGLDVLGAGGDQCAHR